MLVIAVQIVIIAVLILANGLFALSEMAIISARKLRLQARAQEGSEGARTALDLANNPNRFLSTIQIGITLVGTLAGTFGGATLAEDLAAWLEQIKPLARYADAIGVGLVVLIITYLSLVIGELVPKRLALSNPERIAVIVAAPMRFLSWITSPLVRLLSLSTDLVLRLMRVSLPAEQSVTEEEVRMMIEQGTQVGVFEVSEQEMIERVFRLDDRPVSAMMTPRTEVTWLDLEEPFEDLIPIIAASDYSCFPVARDNLDRVVGVVHTRDLLAQSLSGGPIDIQAALCPAQFVPESMSALTVLERLKVSHSQIALVIDEYGGFQGLVTLNDMLEAIVGDIPQLDEHLEPNVVQREDGSWLIDGRLLIDDFKDLFSIQHLPGEETGYYQTVGGFVMAFLGRIPTSGDRFEWAGLRFEVMDMDGLRVDKVLLTEMDQPPDSTSTEGANP